MKKSSQHLILMSLDALNPKDFNYMKNLPNFRSFIEEGSVIQSVNSVFPSVTYTCHSSMITGTYPDKHGVFANEKPDPTHPMSQDWYWYRKDIQVPTLFDLAMKASLTTANVLWPVMAGAKITYNFPEIWSETGESFFSLYFKNGTKNTLPMLLRNIKKFKGKEQPYLDNFVEGIATDMILKKRPNLLCMHLIELDHEKHVSGAFSDANQRAMNHLDAHIGNIIAATKKAGIYDRTTFVMMGDHGSADFSKIISLNTVFAQNGLLQLDQQENIISWMAYGNSCAGSAHIHIHPSAKQSDRKKIEQVLQELLVMEEPFIKHLYTKSEALEKFHLSGSFDYVVEPMEGLIFTNQLLQQIVMNAADVKGSLKAEHGYNPKTIDMKTMLMAKGPKIIKGATIENANIIDAAPTLAHILGLKMENVDGKIIHEILTPQE